VKISYAIFFVLALESFCSTASALEMCRRGMDRETKTCLVDGDTIWLAGIKYRLQGFDTPEPQTGVCGGDREKRLAAKASSRLLKQLNDNAWSLETSGKLGGNRRVLATIRIGVRDVRDILIEERLARKWPDRLKWWCE